MAQPEPMTTATSASGVTTDSQPVGAGSNPKKRKIETESCLFLIEMNGVGALTPQGSSSSFNLALNSSLGHFSASKLMLVVPVPVLKSAPIPCDVEAPKARILFFVAELNLTSEACENGWAGAAVVNSFN